MERVRERASHVQQQFVVYRETVLEANDNVVVHNLPKEVIAVYP